MVRRVLTGLAALVALVAGPGTVKAYLGGFEQSDGYVFAGSGIYSDWVDVTDYNAGQWGPNAGGAPLPFEVPVGSALWSYSSPAGSFFDTPADRVTYMGATPPYNPTTPAVQAQTIASYVIGDHFGGHLGTHALALRNATPGPTSPYFGNTIGPIDYDYKLDSYDFGGVTPSAVTVGTVSTSFWLEANPADPIIPGVRATGKFLMSFKDSSGNVGVQWGYDRTNFVYWRAGNTGPFIPTGIQAEDNYVLDAFDQMKVDIDLSSQTFSITYNDTSASTSTVIANNIPLGATMADVTHIGWELAPDVNSGIGGKNFFDDFQFSVPSKSPEPGTCGVLAAGVLMVVKRRRR